MVQMISTLFCGKKGGIFVQLYWKRVFEDKLLGIYLFGTHSTFSVNHAIRTTCCKRQNLDSPLVLLLIPG